MTSLRSHSLLSRRTAGKAFAAAMGLTLVLTACSAPADKTPSTQSSSAPAASSILAAHNLEGLDAAGVVDRLDALPISERPEGLMASIRPNELLLTDGKNPDLSLPMPTDKFYVSVSPYVTNTHDCFFHSLTTCKGELLEEDIVVKVTNEATGEVLVDGPMKTQPNGFFGMWLPRNIDAKIVVSYSERTATATVSTAKDDDLTCLTTMQLV